MNLAPKINSQKPAEVVFVISQPRAGSTLLQTILSGHPQVTAPGETWLMLPLVHSLCGARRDMKAPYDGFLAEHAVNLFAQNHLQGGMSDLQSEIGLAASRIFASAREKAGADVLVDKTPRYYWIIDDLLRMVPNSRVVLLVRNPLAVLSSIIQTWSRSTLAPHRADLLEAPARLANAMSYGDDRIHTVHYEQLVADPEPVIKNLQEAIGLNVVDGLSNYGEVDQRSFGDPIGIHSDTSTNQGSLEKWVQSAAQSATMWRTLSDYRQILGDDLLARLGYDPRTIDDKLSDVQPFGTSLAPSMQSQLTRVEPVRSIARVRKAAAKAVSSVSRAA